MNEGKQSFSEDTHIAKGKEDHLASEKAYVQKFLNNLKNQRTIKRSHVFLGPEQSIPEKIKQKTAELQNTALEQDIKLKGRTLFALFIFLAVETAIIFAFTFFQAIHVWKFQLEEWSFKLLISATITQITVMLLVAVRHLFPTKK